MITDKNKHSAIVYISFDEIDELRENYNDVENVMESNETLENLMHHLSRVVDDNNKLNNIKVLHCDDDGNLINE